MMEYKEVFIIALILTLGLIGWFWAFNRHQKTSYNDRDAVKLFSILGWFFGGWWLSNRYFNIRGIILQIVLYILIPLWLLARLNLITQQTAIYGSRWSIVIALIIIVVHFFRRK